MGTFTSKSDVLIKAQEEEIWIKLNDEHLYVEVYINQ
jgi:hypothetical protein